MYKMQIESECQGNGLEMEFQILGLSASAINVESIICFRLEKMQVRLDLRTLHPLKISMTITIRSNTRGLDYSRYDTLKERIKN